jgi:hypothetical protein
MKKVTLVSRLTVIIFILSIPRIEAKNCRLAESIKNCNPTEKPILITRDKGLKKYKIKQQWG